MTGKNIVANNDRNLWSSSKKVLRFMVSEAHVITDMDRYVFQINLLNENITTIKYVTPNYKCNVTGHINLALQWASQFNNNLELVKYILSKGANISTNNNYVIRNTLNICNLDLLKYLIENNIVDIKIINNWNMIYNTKYDVTDIVKYLVEKGLPVSANNNELIKWAKAINNKKLVEYLFCEGAILD